jgi:hypothetical protein
VNVSPDALQGRLPVRCGGKFGPRRVRVTECAVVITAESVYDMLLRDDPSKVKPGARVRLETTFGNVSVVVSPNAVWRRGRVFLVCVHCDRRSTRLYAPLATSSLRCRRCWGLSYQSTQQYNYKGGSLFAGMYFSHRDTSMMATQAAKEDLRAKSIARWIARRRLLASH